MVLCAAATAMVCFNPVQEFAEEDGQGRPVVVRKYKVRWLGYDDPKEDTWEPPAMVSG